MEGSDIIQLRADGSTESITQKAYIKELEGVIEKKKEAEEEERIKVLEEKGYFKLEIYHSEYARPYIVYAKRVEVGRIWLRYDNEDTECVLRLDNVSRIEYKGPMKHDIL